MTTVRTPSLLCCQRHACHGEAALPLKRWLLCVMTSVTSYDHPEGGGVHEAQRWSQTAPHARPGDAALTLRSPPRRPRALGRQPCLSCYRSLTLVSSADRHPRAQGHQGGACALELAWRKVRAAPHKNETSTRATGLKARRSRWGGGSRCLTDLMVRVSHPRTAVSFAVATWVQL